MASTEVVWSSATGSAERTLKPGEVATYNLVWDQHDATGKQVDAGYYYVGPEEVPFESIQLGSARVGAIGVARVLIMPAEGAMEKTIEVNKSQTAGEITVTLERVELSALGMKVYAFTTLPDYKFQQGGPQLPPPSMMVHAEAEYSIDGGTMKKAGVSGVRFLENGMEHIWENLAPVPKTAKELTFRITKLGDLEGPWEFQIPLN